ncbi:DUF4192 domain-containing protein [Phytoactinopolyspora endophytica]|uniref:DUF4192 domain-containing protein n=1 Tax=Phytoactinopolyspora endophytica TaxID=1642495 RepID=UPI00101C490F|nr:DUF4192 domain-containing protein [Phytoactinopolyspora endophytica]
MKPNEYQATVSLQSPTEIVGAIPGLLGFHARESLVVVCLHGAAGRAGLAMRVDLPHPDDAEAFAVEMASRIGRENADATVVVCYTEDADTGGELARRHLIDQVLDELFLRDIGWEAALLVRGGRWWSYTCSKPCCPSEGTPIPVMPGGDVYGLEAQRVLHGVAVLPGREALAESVGGPVAPRVVVLRQRFEEACEQLVDELTRRGAGAVRQDTLTALNAMRERYLSGERDLDDAAVVRVLAGLEDKWVRDALITWGLDERGEEVLAFLIALAQYAVDEGCAAICTVVAAVGYQQGHGALASVALERVLRCAPEYQMARLLDALLDAQVNPREIRAMARRVQRELISRAVISDGSSVAA